MKKTLTNGLFCVAALGLALGLGACNKNEDCCGGGCKDKAVMKDGTVTEASAKSCSEKASGCCKDKAVMTEGSVTEASAKSCTEKKACCKKDAAAQN